MDKTKLILGFPGVGKSYFAVNNKNYKIIDLDASTFPKDNFPDNYIKSILNNIGKVDIIFISTYDVIRKALKKCDIFTNTNVDKVYLVYPSIELKDEYIKRYNNRGNNKQFINTLNMMFDNWVDELKNEDTSFIKIELTNEYDSITTIFNKL
jgi:hypothetical protein